MEPPASPIGDESTEIVPATAAATAPLAAQTAAGTGPPLPETGRNWFDDRLRDFVQALATDAKGHSRPTDARQALAAAARDLIDRIANQRPLDEPDPGWPRDAVLQPHQLLANTFEVRSLIATGGVGQIYRTRHRDLRTEHAVKILLPRHTLHPALTAMLITEARLLSRIRHPGVVDCLGLLRDTDGRLLLVMEHIRGSTLSARLHDGPLSEPELLALARRLLESLAFIHAAGVVHNDLAPDNIMLRDDNAADPVLVDFGLARPLDPAVAPETDAVAIDFAGKLSWICPERLSAPGAPPDPRSDLYGAGLVLAAASTGQRLAMGTDTASAIAARQALPALEGVPRVLHPMLAALLQPSRDSRPDTADLALRLLDPAIPRSTPAALAARFWNNLS